MSTERERSRDHVTTHFPTEYVRAGEPRPLTCTTVEHGGHVVTAHERCSTCSGVLVHITRHGQPALTCPRVACPGHNRAATSNAAGRTPDAGSPSASGNRAAQTIARPIPHAKGKP